MSRALASAAALCVALHGAVAGAQPTGDAEAEGAADAKATEGTEETEGADRGAPRPRPVEAAPRADDDVMRYPPSSVRIGLIAGGLGLTLGAYGLSALMAATFDDVPGATALYIPVAGPWISLAQNDCAPDDPDCGAILVLRGILLVIDGLAQAGGLGIAGEGLFMTTEASGPADSAILVAPTVGPHSAGIGVGGTF